MHCARADCTHLIDPNNKHFPTIFDEGVEKTFCCAACQAIFLRHKWRSDAAQPALLLQKETPLP